MIIGAYQRVGAMVCCFSTNYITYLKFKKAKKINIPLFSEGFLDIVHYQSNYRNYYWLVQVSKKYEHFKPSCSMLCK